MNESLGDIPMAADMAAKTDRAIDAMFDTAAVAFEAQAAPVLIRLRSLEHFANVQWKEPE